MHEGDPVAGITATTDQTTSSQGMHCHATFHNRPFSLACSRDVVAG